MKKIFIVLFCCVLVGCKSDGICIGGDCENGQGAHILINEGLWIITKYETTISVNRYEGEFKEGKFNGQGTMNYTEVIDGIADEHKYEGEWKDGQRHGQGTLLFDNGAKYIGEWKCGEQNGQGTYAYTSGNKYEGEWKDGQQHGQGTWIFSDGIKNVGEWKCGEQNGQGTWIYPDEVKGFFDTLSRIINDDLQVNP